MRINDNVQLKKMTVMSLIMLIIHDFMFFINLIKIIVLFVLFYFIIIYQIESTFRFVNKRFNLTFNLISRTCSCSMLASTSMSYSCPCTGTDWGLGVAFCAVRDSRPGKEHQDTHWNID